MSLTFYGSKATRYIALHLSIPSKSLVHTVRLQPRDALSCQPLSHERRVSRLGQCATRRDTRDIVYALLGEDRVEHLGVLRRAGSVLVALCSPLVRAAPLASLWCSYHTPVGDVCPVPRVGALRCPSRAWC